MFRKQVDPEEGRMKRLLTNAENALFAAFLEAVRKGAVAPGSIEELAQQIEQGNLEAAILLASAALGTIFSQQYAAQYAIVGRSSADKIESTIDVLIGFNTVNQRAVNHLQQERLDLITEFTQQQRLATQIALIDGTRRGLNPIAQAREFRQSIGLTERQMRAVVNYRHLLERTSLGDSESLTRALRDRRYDRTVRNSVRARVPLTIAMTDRMVQRYTERYVRYRSEVIARTEALRAVHAANYEAFQQAIEGGGVQAQELIRQWHTARDERVRETHVAADGQKRGINEPFLVGGAELRYPGDSLGPAREVVNCRCIETIRVRS